MGTDIQKNSAFQDLLRRAEQGDWAACAKVGHIYSAGDQSLGIAPNRALAAQYYERGAKAGDLPCMYGYAGTCLHNQPAKAIELLEICAQKKYVWSLATLGDLYLRGRYVPQDAGKALQYLQEYNVVCKPETVGSNTFKVRWDLVLYPLCLLQGIGGVRDEKKATDELSRLAALGNLSATDILRTGKLSDWMAAKRFNFDIRANGPVTLFTPAGGGSQSQGDGAFTNNPQVHQAKYEVVHREKLSRFLQRSLIPGEPILMRAAFPRIYTVDSYLRLFFFLGLGRWIEHMMAMHNDIFYHILPYQAYVGLYNYPQWPVVIFGVCGIFIFLRRMVRKWTTEIVLTDKRFIYKHGLFSIEMVQMNFWQIEHSDVTQSILGNLLDYGVVHIQSFAVQNREDPSAAGRGMLLLPQIAHPFLFSRLIEDNRQLPFRYKGGERPLPMYGVGN